MKSTDPASLQNLNDIVLPATVSWWPLAIGWYFLAALLLIAFAWFARRSLQRWMHNRYRRAALRELQLLAKGVRSAGGRDSSLSQLPILLKRTALAAYPRRQVAALTGRDWHDFLNSKVSTPTFTQSTVTTLDNIAYSTGELSAVDLQAATALLNASQHWLQHHQTTPRLKHSRET